ncbi:MAG: endolytic transglycosylase MltG [Candidatus Moraniibacteriota bacterium]
MRLIISMVKAVGVVFIVAVVIGGVSYAYLLNRADSARGTLSENQRFTIQSGEGVVSIAERLDKAGIIDGSLTFIAYAVKTGRYKQFQVGEYSLSGQLSIPEIIERFVAGKVVPAGVRITFPEGWTMHEMAERLTANDLAGADFLAIAKRPFPKWQERYSFLKDLPAGASLEGYLFPDTYIFPAQATGELIVNELLKNFEAKIVSVITEGLVARGLSLHEAVTLASIIEEEGRTEEDRKNISDVFRKRLAIGQPLQSDATINYIHGTAKDQPTFEDLQSTSPYNTYVRSGLPPGPIGNPSLMSIRATLYPTANPYFYFLIDTETRVTYFAEDFDGHQRNRAAHGL